MKKYILITPARNEEAYIEQCIKSVLAQTLPPAEWIIVSDRSTDNTDRIVESWASKCGFMKIVKLPPGLGRDFASKVGAFNVGYGSIAAREYDFIGNLDADISFAPDYFERLLGRFEVDEKLGVGGGVILELVGGKFRKQMTSGNSVAGAIQLFRRRCFEDIGGFVPMKYGGVDSTAEITARMKGWSVRAFDDLEVYHHRRVSGSAGVVKSRFRAGVMHYQIGYHPFFQLASSALRLGERPFVIGGLLTFLGYLWAALSGPERLATKSQAKYLAEEQLSRLRSALFPGFLKKIPLIRRQGGERTYK